MTEDSLGFAGVGDYQVITRAGQVEAVVVPMEEYRALKVLEQRMTELYWGVHEARYPSRPGDDAPEGPVHPPDGCGPIDLWLLSQCLPALEMAVS